MIDEIYILNQNKKIICILSNKYFFNYEYHSYLETGADTFDFDVRIDKNTSGKINRFGFVLFLRKNKPRMFQIMQIKEEETILSTTKRIESETVALELRNSHLRPCSIEGNMTTFLSTVLQDTNYKIGYIDPKLDNIIKTTNITEITPVYTALQDAIITYDNCELEFDVEIIDSISGNYNLKVNVYADGERGNKTYKRIEYDFNTYGMSKNDDNTEFCTGIIPVGVNSLDIKKIEWYKLQGFPVDKPLEQDFIIDPELNEMFNYEGKPILRKISFDDTTANDLCWSAYKKLQEIKQFKSDYDVPVFLTDKEYDEIDIGDTVHIINDKFETPIQLEARISELILTDSENKCKFSNYKEVKSNIKEINKNDIIKDTIKEINGFTGKLNQAQIDTVKSYLENIGIQSNTIESLLKKFKESLEEKVTEVDETDIAEDSENYRKIKLEKIDNGLWIGDDRLYAVKKNKSNVIVSKNKVAESTDTKSPSSAVATEYKDAVSYYEKFSLGTKANTSYMSALWSKSNKYKLYVMVEYWSKKFGLDPYLVYAMIMAESSGNPYCATKYSGGGYGLMQCEREAYFNRSTKITFYDGSTKSFTPSYSTLKPGAQGNTTINGVTVDKAISNQIMFGCHEFRVSLKRFKWNIFAALQGYNFGLYGCDWCICKYVAVKNGYSFVNKFGYTCQSSKVQKAYFEELENMKCRWASYRKVYQDTFKAGTWWYIEAVLRYYKSVDGQLPYVIVDGKKKGYGANKTATTTVTQNTTIKTGVATSVRNKIVAKAREIVDLHVKYKVATYDQGNRICDDSKRFKARGTISGIKNPYCYDCSSLVSCAYLAAGLKSVYAKSCSAGSLVSSATSKSGWKLWKCTESNLDKYAIAGDIIMVCNSTVPSTPNKNQSTHHTLIYCGKVDGKHMVAHARGWRSWPNAIRYMEVYSDLYRYGMILRPWDLAKADSEATETVTKTTNTVSYITKIIETNEINIKALNSTTAADFYSDNSLIEDLTVNNITDNSKYPASVSHCFLHFGINDLSDEAIESYKSLINILLIKYPKKPIFIAKEYYVGSSYGDDYENLNVQITNFNNKMKDFANKTKYVIQVGVPAKILDSTVSYLEPELTSDGWTLKDKTATDTYYQAYKKAILVLATGGEVTSTNTETNLCLHTENIYTYTNPVKSLTFRLPTKPDDSYYSRLVFKTNSKSEPTKFYQSDLVYLQGTHCKNGQLIPYADTTYTISIYYNPDTEISDKLYLGNVAGITKGKTYNSFAAFKDADTLVKNAKTFYDNTSKFVYNTKTPADFINPADNKSQWIDSDGKMHIDDSSFLNYILMGWDFKGTPYGDNSKTSNKKNTKYSWSLSSTRNEADIAKYFVQQGWVHYQADLDNYTNINPGDIIFMDADSINNGLFMAVSHTAIVTGTKDGKLQALECNDTNIFRYINVEDLESKNILFIGRIRKD